MSKLSPTKSFSVIFETENLGMAGLTELEASLDSLKKQAFPIATANEVLVVIGGHVSNQIQKRIKQKYPWTKIYMSKNNLDYARSKMVGAKAATGEILIFADSDMQYEKSWLGNMITAFNTHPKGYIMSGDTRLETNSSYNMALNCTWMIQILSDKVLRPVPTTFFPLNNFAVAREVILKTPIPYKLQLYRNKIPIWEQTLIYRGHKIIRIPGTRGYHAPPGNFFDWFYRMLIYGSDFVAMVDFSPDVNGTIQEKKNLPKRLFNILFLFPWKVEQLILNSWKLLKEDLTYTKFLPGALVIGLTNIIVIEIGAVLAFFNRNLVFNKITAREEAHIV